MPRNKHKTIIIGGGFYGLRTAQFLVEELGQKNVVVLERESELMKKASYNNQARVHNGYHYPRSVLTALRSKVNLPIFSKEYELAIHKDFKKIYGVSSTLSKVTAKQFEEFFKRIGTPIEVDEDARELFDDRLVESSFKVQEYAFDSDKLRNIVMAKLEKLSVEIRCNVEVKSVRKNKDNTISVSTNKGDEKADFVLNMTYSSIDSINHASKLPVLPLKHELTEMCLVNLPKELKDKAITMMCGPFFSIMPFPSLGLHTLSHVRYTPHKAWTNASHKVHDSKQQLEKYSRESHFPKMIADVKRFMPKLAEEITYTGKSLWEVKTVLMQSEDDDSRPILYKEHHGGLRNYICIMGGKIDNIYDVFKELKKTYAQA